MADEDDQPRIPWPHEAHRIVGRAGLEACRETLRRAQPARPVAGPLTASGARIDDEATQATG